MHRRYNPTGEGKALTVRYRMEDGRDSLPVRLPAVVVYVKPLSRRLREVSRLIDHLGLAVCWHGADGVIAGSPRQVSGNPVGNNPGTFVVVGAASDEGFAALVRLCEHPAVDSWHYVLEASADCRAAGSAPSK